MARLLVTCMEQREQPVGAPSAAPSAGATVEPWTPGVEEYLRLYRAVGQSVQWDEHLRLPENALEAFLQADTTEIFLLSDGEEAVGLCESAWIANRSIRITHFGLIPAAQGKGFGRFLLDRALRALWRRQPRRIWLRTDTNDHPAAVGTYARAGFVAYRREWQDFPD